MVSVGVGFASVDNPVVGVASIIDDFLNIENEIFKALLSTKFAKYFVRELFDIANLFFELWQASWNLLDKVVCFNLLLLIGLFG